MEYGRIIVIQVDSILGYPSTIALIHDLIKRGKDVLLFSTRTDDAVKSVLPESVKLVNIGDQYVYETSFCQKFIKLFSIRKKIWKEINSVYDTNSLLWVMSNITIKHMGMELLKYNYNLHLFELIDSLYYFGKNEIFRINIKKLCDNANKVLVCEYNRACITQAWFKLRESPLVMLNRPAPNGIQKNTSEFHDKNGEKTIESLNGKKIILYQGIVDKERPIEAIAQAVEELDDSFVFLVMSGSPCDELKKYKSTIVVPFIQPPFHLEVTSHAYIGVLLYMPVYGVFTSPLNSIYCAPNKLYEYSQFSLPMIGNNIPGLKYTIEYNNMGVCINEIEKDQIISAIMKIDKEYERMSENSNVFFKNSTNEHTIDLALEMQKA